jgi:hypothetical protein
MCVFRHAVAAILAAAVAFCVSTSTAAITVVILKPKAGDTVVIGGTFETKFWISQEAPVLPTVSIDKGKTWIGLFPPDFMGCVQAKDTTKWTWNVQQPELRAGTALFRIAGYIDPNIQATSGQFVLASRASVIRGPCVRRGFFPIDMRGSRNGLVFAGLDNPAVDLQASLFSPMGRLVARRMVSHGATMPGPSPAGFSIVTIASEGRDAAGPVLVPVVQ